MAPTRIRLLLPTDLNLRRHVSQYNPFFHAPSQTLKPSPIPTEAPSGTSLQSPSDDAASQVNKSPGSPVFPLRPVGTVSITTHAIHGSQLEYQFISTTGDTLQDVASLPEPGSVGDIAMHHHPSGAQVWIGKREKPRLTL
ncbi:hypothetical protein FRB99_004662, partial [Tulasnella sp. 403]